MTTALKSIKDLKAEARNLLKEAKSIFDKGEAATPEEVATARTKRDEAKAIADRLANTDGASMLEALKTVNTIDNTIAVLEQPDRPPLDGVPGTQAHGDGAALDRKGQLKTIGQALISDPVMVNYLKQITSGGRIPDGTSIRTPPVHLKTLITNATDAASGRPLLGQADRRAEVVGLNWTPLVLRNLITVLTTTSDLVEVVRELSRTNNAAIVPEATSTATGGTGVKPESGLAWEVVSVPVKTLAHWIPVTTRALEDQDRLRGEIDSFLRMGIDQAWETAILNGLGTGNDYAGVLNTPGTLTQAWFANASLAISLLTTTRRARTTLRVQGKTTPTAWLMSPADWEQIDLLQDAEQRYYFGGPWVLGTPRLWGVPVVESEYEPDGTAVLANWADAVAYDRQQTVVTMSNSHMDFFIKNLVAVLAEARVAFHIRRPRSFVEVAMRAVP